MPIEPTARATYVATHVAAYYTIYGASSRAIYDAISRPTAYAIYDATNAIHYA